MSKTRYVFPKDLHNALQTERISVSPTSEPADGDAAFYAFKFDACQEESVSDFGSSPSEAVSRVLMRLGHEITLMGAYGEPVAGQVVYGAVVPERIREAYASADSADIVLGYHKVMHEFIPS